MKKNNNLKWFTNNLIFNYLWNCEVVREIERENIETGESERVFNHNEASLSLQTQFVVDVSEVWRG